VRSERKVSVSFPRAKSVPNGEVSYPRQALPTRLGSVLVAILGVRHLDLSRAPDGVALPSVSDWVTRPGGLPQPESGLALPIQRPLPEGAMLRANVKDEDVRQNPVALGEPALAA
jgi:hypothetical protein